MQNLSAMHIPSTRPLSSRYTGIAFAALINGVAIWAIMNGLNFHPSSTPPQPTHITFVKPDVQPKQTAQPPQPTMFKPTMPKTPVVLQPIIPIEQPSNQNPITVTTQPQQSVVPPMPNSQASGITETHTTPPYPASARNLSQHGVVTLQISIDATGAVTNASVKTSSGYPELDQTAIDWVVAHWRYKPAIQGGSAVASTAMAAIKFDLKNAR